MVESTSLLTGFLFFSLGGLFIWILLLQRKINRLLRKGRSASLDETISSIDSEIRDLKNFKDKTEKYLISAESRLKRSVQGIGTVHFQAFRGGGHGGKHSFASAIMNENGDGLVISALYSRELVGVYAKPVVKNNSSHELTEEEKQAIENAKTYK